MRRIIEALDIGALDRSKIGMEIIAKTTDPDKRDQLLRQEIHKIKTQLILKL